MNPAQDESMMFLSCPFLYGLCPFRWCFLYISRRSTAVLHFCSGIP